MNKEFPLIYFYVSSNGLNCLDVDEVEFETVDSFNFGNLIDCVKEKGVLRPYILTDSIEDAFFELSMTDNMFERYLDNVNDLARNISSYHIPNSDIGISDGSNKLFSRLYSANRDKQRYIVLEEVLSRYKSALAQSDYQFCFVDEVSNYISNINDKTMNKGFVFDNDSVLRGLKARFNNSEVLGEIKKKYGFIN